MFTADQLLFHSSRGSFQIPQKGGLLMKTLFSTLFSFAERFAGPLTIFVIAPGVTGFPVLNLTGQFLWKDIVLASAAITVVARDAARHEAKRAQRTQLASRSEEHTLSPVNSESKQVNDAVPKDQTHSQPL